MTIRLIVKGNADEAQRAAAFNGVLLTTVVSENERFTETIMLAPQHTLRRVQAWFHDCPHNAAPYPVGTLLWYRD